MCMLELTTQDTPPHCTTLASLFPPIDKDPKITPFYPHLKNLGRYHCFNFTGRVHNYGNLPTDWCNRTMGDASRIGPRARGGLFWCCGRGLLMHIKPGAKGLCAMVRLAAPLTLIGSKAHLTLTSRSTASLTRRRCRHVPTKRFTFDLSSGSTTYIDATGVPRGV